ncbi:hotdog fold thioesterase [Ferruginibacter sp.]|uniref:hotdog fold thioesterase n=1 Tax=Ferruginibacter sp. TaxID=1940288 RepID=UPI0026586C88|nr:PaaI family thioesterase [Ferruginibacter sp.]
MFQSVKNKTMAIWFNKSLKLEGLLASELGPMDTLLGMEYAAIGENYLKIKMPVDERTRQPYGLLHGGASCTLAETTGSMASSLVIDPDKFICVGLEINANHVKSARQGHVIATATPLHLGTNTHVWDVKIHDDAEKLICVSRLTVAILKKAF